MSNDMGGQKIISPFKKKNNNEEEENDDKIIFHLMPTQIHRVPDNIRKALKVGKFRKTTTNGNKQNNQEAPVTEYNGFKDRMSGNLHVRKIFNFNQVKQSLGENILEQEIEPLPSPYRLENTNRYTSNDIIGKGGGMLYVKKKQLSPLKKGLTVEPRSTVSRDKKNIKVTFLNIEKVQLTKMYENLDNEQKRPQKKIMALTSSLMEKKNENELQNFLQSTSFSVKNSFKRTFCGNQEKSILKSKYKPFTQPFNRYSYRDFIWKAALSYNIHHQSPETYEKKIRIYIGKGNNSLLIRSLFKRRRAWITFTDRIQDANFVWTQIKINQIYHYQKMHQSAIIVKKQKCPPINFYNPNQKKDQGQNIQSANQQQKNINITKKAITNNQLSQLNILTKHDLAHWENYFLKHRKSEDTLDQTMKKRNKYFFNNLSCREITKINVQKEGKFGRIHNHLPNNYIIGNKKALFFTMSRYYERIGQEVFEYLPLTFHIQNGLEDQEYLKFLNSYYARAKRIRAREKGSPDKQRQSSPEKGKQNFAEESMENQDSQQNPSSRTSVRNMWIVKPGEFTNRGNGITVCMNLQQIKAILKKKERHDNGNLKTYIIQSYIEKPFLYQRRKFDIRHFMMISSINGIIKGYWYENGYIRTTSFEYTLNNSFTNVHLTNDAVQKFLPEYGKYERGNKVSYDDFQKYLDKEYQGKYNFYDEIYPKMRKIATDAIKACAMSIDPERKGPNFQIFGMDFMIDADFHPWLIQINNNPCLQISCAWMNDIIPPMLESAFRICLDSLIPPPATFTQKRPKFNDTNAFEINKFELVYNSIEEQTLEETNSVLDLDYKQMEKQQQNQVFEDDGIELEDY